MKLAKVKAGLIKGAAVVGTLGATAQLALAQNVDFANIGAVPIVEEGLLTLAGRLISYLLIFTGIIAVAYLIYGGLIYITAGGDAEKASKGRVAITNAIIGIIIIMASYAIYTAVINTGKGPGTATNEQINQAPNLR